MTSPLSDTTIDTAKKALRTELRIKRKTMSPSVRAIANVRIIEQLCTLITRNNYTRIAAYCPGEKEPGGVELLKNLDAYVDELWLPLSRSQFQLEWARYQGSEYLRVGKHNIYEPMGKSFSSEILHALDLIIVPALGATPHGHRLGQGGGYYDRAMKNISTPQVMLLFASEIRSDIPIADHDICIKKIISA
ncbi:5-formyltetrahydrofolate cyclo-ligase [Corynebacterium sp. sy017]|uniref:5-formyltetrahydrofolate cyclo-ligase n=1 Tax=unclassified Corynebacterium TaxID=2624378 RepID=UPI0011853973|nr:MULTISPECIES: 5-formyltetrahydrofolate cyclo-ligase [unclassified Corynebacterium]MBP3088857.1 5-formyltetrahydrofolate cyclo-ligase [Corynebacterium sp. sy017]TSD91199.1 5-formyltetrahydrofolate cyclo-ligase [Corynebacterium sp. SY003]